MRVVLVIPTKNSLRGRRHQRLLQKTVRGVEELMDAPPERFDALVLVSDTSVLVDLQRGGVLEIALGSPCEFAVLDEPWGVGWTRAGGTDYRVGA